MSSLLPTVNGNTGHSANGESESSPQFLSNNASHSTNGDLETHPPLVDNSSPNDLPGGAPETHHPTVNGSSPQELPGDVPTKYDVLIIGTGPAGASLASFLTSHGITGLMISSAATSADTPRAHITNIAALEALRDVGLDEECVRLGSLGDCMMHTRWCHSMAGEEYARIYSWGNDPQRKGDYEAASPCAPCDLPQTLLEPALIRYATTHGFKCRFDTSFVSYQDNGPSGVVTTLVDNLSGKEFKIQSKYLFGADGARSRVMKQLALPLIAKPGSGVAINVLVKADLSHLIEHRQGNLHWVMQPDRPHCDLGWMAIVRMVKPWTEWMFILFPKPGVERPEPSREEYQAQVKNLIGDDSIPVEIVNISRWTINDIVASKYSQDNVFCLGDAVHRHPPFNGLGSNTCIQDAFNLAWKIAYVLKGYASANLLSTYSVERQPVGQSIISRANTSFHEHARIWKVLGMFPEELSDRVAMLNELTAATPAGQSRRKELQAAIKGTSHEFHGLGIEMNQFYTGPGIYAADEPVPFALEGRAAEDPVLYYMPSTYPGKRLPHVWLNKKCPGTPISTVDLAGKGKFTLLTGIGGEAWKLAAAVVEKELSSEMNAYSIGFGQDWVDVYSDWDSLRGVNESGALLVRPDRFVAWRCNDVLSDETTCADKLVQVMRSILKN
ncbi:2,4-dichlorophenol 6-monooxygenase [Lachnellula occidentalis]|uniref:2,4-dichlorophenol 6-monooxygenase n=1 Tax=Lachnellula occidentalis TaxID=215460 RepID=A0A8H8RQP9_9HELO|nr:2,4-dichlorophenol 6-monooxygenase [Lachnellula occidentalis]